MFKLLQFLVCLLTIGMAVQLCPAQEPATIEPDAAKVTETKSEEAGESDTDLDPGEIALREIEAAREKMEREFDQQSIPIPDSWKRLGESHLWADPTNKQVIIRGFICLNNGGLEMFACPRNTKEHESIVSAHAQSSEVHAALVALGFDPGSTVQWQPEYKAATGPMVSVEVHWMEGETMQKRNAREMVRNFHTEELLQTDWVFGGSQLVHDPASGEDIYYGDGGEMLCLSNFATATLDLPIKSSADAELLMYRAVTESIPPLNAKVYLVLTPRKTE